MDRTGPTLSGLPREGCRIWPPTGKMVHVADVVDDRVYTLTATVTDRAGNATTGSASCVVPHDLRR